MIAVVLCALAVVAATCAAIVVLNVRALRLTVARLDTLDADDRARDRADDWRMGRAG